MITHRFLIAGLFAVCASAQFPTAPPPILQVIRVPGGAAGKPYAQAGLAVDVVGSSAITGFPETWLMEAHPSFASIEDLDRALGSQLPRPVDFSDSSQNGLYAPPRTMIAVFRPAWSYRPVDASRMFPKTRYLMVSVIHLRPGGEADYAELVRMRRATSESVNLDRPDLVYQVISGASSGTFLFVTPLTTLRIFDDGVPPVPAYAEGLAAARAKEGPKIAAETELEREHFFLRVDPRISYVSDVFAQSDTEFWRGKPGN